MKRRNSGFITIIFRQTPLVALAGVILIAFFPDYIRNDSFSSSMRENNKPRSILDGAGDNGIKIPTVTVYNKKSVTVNKSASSPFFNRIEKPMQLAKESGAYVAEGIEVPLPIQVNGTEQAIEVVKITTDNNPRILFFYSESIIGVFSNCLLEEKVNLFKEAVKGKVRFAPEDVVQLGIEIKYDLSGSVVILVPQNWLKNEDITFSKRNAKNLNPNTFPSKVSGVLDLSAQVDKTYSPGDSLDSKYLLANLTLNTYGLVTTTGVRQTNESFHRGETNLVYSFSKNSELWLGDITSSSYSAPGNISGAGYFRSSNADSSGSFIKADSIEIPTLSRVYIYKNEQLIKELRANPGKISLNGLPIDAGNNIIRIVIEDIVTGKQTERTFSEFIALSGEKKGDYSYYVMSGKTRRIDNEEIEYSKENSFAGGINYGLTNSLTSGLSIQKIDYAGAASVNGSFSFPGFAVQLKATKQIDISGTQNEYVLRTSKSGNMSVLKNIYTEIKNVQRETGDPIYDDVVFTSNASFKPFYGFSSFAGYSKFHKTDGIEAASYFVGAGRSFRISRKMNLSGNIRNSSYSNGKPDNFEFSLTLTYSDHTEYGRFSSSMSENNNTRSIQAGLGYNDIKMSAGIGSNKKTDAISKSASISKQGYLGSVSGSYNQAGNSSSYSLKGQTGIFFADGVFAVGQPTRSSFLIISNDGIKGDFDVSNGGGKTVSEGKFFNTSVVTVGNYSISSFSATPREIDQMSLEASKSFIYQSEYKTGCAVFFKNSNRILAVAKVVDKNGNPIQRADITIICTTNGTETSQELFTDGDGLISFSADRGSKCVMKSDEYRSAEIDLDFMTKYKELDDIKLTKMESVK